MALLIGPIIDRLSEILLEGTPEFLTEAFAGYYHLWTGQAVNLPAVWILPVRTLFAEDEATRHQAHEITVKFGVSNSEPEALYDLVIATMLAVDQAIEQSWPADWSDAVTAGQVMSLYIREHDYGVVLQHAGMFARFPELSLVIETQEAREES
jgi:hypothetical protein